MRLVDRRKVGSGNIDLLQSPTEINGIDFTERHTETNAGAGGLEFVVGVHHADLAAVGPRGAGVDIDGPGNAVVREIRVHGAQHQLPVVLAGVDLQAQVVAGAKGIFLLEAEHQGQAVGAGKAGAELQVARGFFHHRQVQVHLVGRTRHFLRVDVDFGEKPETVHAIT